jgi:hypothetical protein
VSSPCKRSASVIRVDATPAGGAKLTLPHGCAGFTLRVVDSTGAGIAWTLAVSQGGSAFHFAAGEAYSEDRLALDGDRDFFVVGAGTAELITWGE